MIGDTMFQCENDTCRKMTEPGQPVNRVVTERRDKTYQRKLRRGRDKGKVIFVQGWEIVKEIEVCPPCFASMTGLQPKTILPKVEPQTERQKRRRFNDDRPFRKTKRKPAENTNRKKPIVEFIKKVPNAKSKAPRSQ